LNKTIKSFAIFLSSAVQQTETHEIMYEYTEVFQYEEFKPGLRKKPLI